jgi:protein-tyrosine-phosphatase
MFAVAAAMLVLIAVLATLQYRWLGRISDAERERLTATLSARADAYAKDFDRELALAYMLFQLEPAIPGSPAPQAESLTARLAERQDRWQATARYPKLIRELYVTARAAEGSVTLQRFNRTAGLLEPVEWPASLTAIRGQLGEAREEKTANGTLVVRTIAPALWEQVPALVVPGAPTPLFLLDAPANHAGARLSPGTSMSYVVLLLDRQFIAGELLPALAAHHFSAAGGDPQYQLAVVETGKSDVVYRSAAGFSPPPAEKVDASAELFQVRLQEFPQLVADAPSLDFVFTVCDNAAGETCPIWPGQPMTAHWGIPDPAEATGSEAEIALAFKDAYRMLNQRIGIFVALPVQSLDRLTLQSKLRDIGRISHAREPT